MNLPYYYVYWLTRENSLRKIRLNLYSGGVSADNITIRPIRLCNILTEVAYLSERRKSHNWLPFLIYRSNTKSVSVSSLNLQTVEIHDLLLTMCENCEEVVTT